MSNLNWFKSSFSLWDNCLEVAWKKSTYSGSATQGECVEAHLEGDGVAVRDSKDPDGAVLSFNAPEWQAFIQGVKAGEFDLV